MSVQILGFPWNPVTGCTKISSGCKGCYAESFSARLQGMKNKRYTNGFALTLHPDLLDVPLKRKKPEIYFVNSMSDLLHKDVPFDFIQSAFKTMNECPQHTFQILTKRSDILAKYAPLLNWTDNIWQGISVESQQYVYRIDDLRIVPAKVRFIYFEPLIGPIENLNLQGIHWAVVGGESGPSWRPMDVVWVREIRDACVAQNVRFCFKQFAALHPEKLGRDLDGVVWDERP
jgi:protein gp37